MASHQGGQMITRCGWCGAKTALTEISRHEAKRAHHPDGVEEAIWWILYQCVSCEEPTLCTAWYLSGVQESEPRVIFPSDTTDDSALPLPVRKAWVAALAVRHVEPNAFAVLVRRTLETICHVEGAAGRTLIQKLTVLAESDRIPGVLAEIANSLREIGNLGAHASAVDEVRPADVPLIYDFADAIIEYLYRAPAKVEAVKARLGKSESPEPMQRP